MILSFKTKFPNGKQTEFVPKILGGIKIHSLREGDRWKEGDYIHMATGVRTKEYKQFNTEKPHLQSCISVQEIFITYNGYLVEMTIDNKKYLNQTEVQRLIANDGLTEKQFLNWFFPKGKDEWSGQIIHWTDYKY